MADTLDSDPDPARPAAGGRADAARPTRRPATHARTDRQSAGRSGATTPESLYLWRIAVLEARVERLQRRVESKERDLQHVVDRYEGVLAERTAGDRELLTDGGNSIDRDSSTSHRDGSASRDRDGLPHLLARLRSLVG